MTFDFSNLEVSQATAWCELPEVSPEARLLLKPATEENPGYYNAMLRKAGPRARKIARTQRLTSEDGKLNREEDRVLYPRFVIQNWEGVMDSKNKKVAFNRDNVVEFCEKLPDWLFDRVRNFASTQERFLDLDEEETPDPVKLAKN